jgi:hypothetical protein
MLPHRIDTNKNLEKTSYMHVLPEYLTTFSLILAVCGKENCIFHVSNVNCVSKSRKEAELRANDPHARPIFIHTHVRKKR